MSIITKKQSHVGPVELSQFVEDLKTRVFLYVCNLFCKCVLGIWVTTAEILCMANSADVVELIALRLLRLLNGIHQLDGIFLYICHKFTLELSNYMRFRTSNSKKFCKNIWNWNLVLWLSLCWEHKKMETKGRVTDRVQTQ